MSYRDCIGQHPDLSESQRKKLVKEYDGLFDTYKETLGSVRAAEKAALDFINLKEKKLTAELNNKMRDTASWIETQRDLDALRAISEAEINEAKAGQGLLWNNPVASAVRQKLERTFTKQGALERRAHISISNIVEKYRPKAGGLQQDVEGFKQVVDAMMGKAVDDPVKAAEGKQLRELFDSLHRQHEAAGGVLGKIYNYFMQRHNPDKIKRVPADQWKADLMAPGELNRQKMINPRTALPYTDDELSSALDELRVEIETNGLAGLQDAVEEGARNLGQRAVNMRHSLSRLLHFTDADAFHRYNNKYGTGEKELYHDTMYHIHRMTRDIALMREFGPNPDAQMDRMKIWAEANGVQRGIAVIDDMWKVLAGRTEFRGNEDKWYRYLSDFQNVIRSALLSASAISTIPDLQFARQAAKLNGLKPSKVINTYAKMLNPASNTDRMFARRNILAATAAQGASIRNTRFIDETSGGHRASIMLANFTHFAGGQGAMTDAIRTAPIIEATGFMAHAAEVKMPYRDLPDAMKEALARWNMDEADYNNIISSGFLNDPNYGGTFIRPEEVAAAGHVSTADKYDAWLYDMSQVASNEPRLLTKALAGQGMTSGTLKRASVGSLMMFKSFGVTVMLNHTIPTFRKAASGSFKPLAELAVGSMLLGAMVTQLHEVRKGRTPRDMTQGKFWVESLLRGGSFGLFGDFVFQDTTEYNRSWAASAAGPVVGTIERFHDALIGGDPLPDLTAATTSLMPAKLWYYGLFVDRMILDQINKMVDPDFDRRVRRAQRRRDELGQEDWWTQGEMEPNL